jgi:hypothetical protein
LPGCPRLSDPVAAAFACNFPERRISGAGGISTDCRQTVKVVDKPDYGVRRVGNGPDSLKALCGAKRSGPSAKALWDNHGMEAPSSASLRAATTVTARYGVAGTLFATAVGLTKTLWEHAVFGWIDEAIGRQVETMEPLKTLLSKPWLLASSVVAVWAIWIVVLAHIRDSRARAAEVPKAVSVDPAPIKIEQTITGSGNRQAGRDLIETHETHVHHDPLVASRFEEFQRIEDFLLKKDEMQLRETFDFPDMLKFNLRLAKNFFWPGSVPQRDMDEMNEFWKDGRCVMYKPFLDSHLAANNLYMKGKPGHIYLANTSKRFIGAQEELKGLSSSPKLPLDVVNALIDFGNTVDYNISMFPVSLTNSYTQNQRNIRESGDSASDRQSAAWNQYWGIFTHLKPKVEVIGLAIRSFLDHKQ